jgi:uncharacterized SAM-binding protein YcdF (DUF218 family)
MFFYASKIIAFFIWPSNVIAMLLVAGTLMVLTGRLVWWGKRLLAAGLGLLLLCGYGPVGTLLVLPLEQRFTRQALPPDVAGVIILGGFESGAVAAARGELSLNEAAERLTEGLLVAIDRPRAKVVFSGDDGTLFASPSNVATTVGRWLEAVGIARERIVLEGKSRTTWENALFLHDILKPQPGQRWVLVTSAFHMPRSVGTFRRLGFDVLPWPADYRTRGARDLIGMAVAFPGGLDRTDLAFKEWVGLVAYRLTGRSSAFWPGQEKRSAGPVLPSASGASPSPSR